jgi:hypothetical protein
MALLLLAVWELNSNVIITKKGLFMYRYKTRDFITQHLPPEGFGPQSSPVHCVRRPLASTVHCVRRPLASAVHCTALGKLF